MFIAGIHQTHDSYVKNRGSPLTPGFWKLAAAAHVLLFEVGIPKLYESLLS